MTMFPEIIQRFSPFSQVFKESGFKVYLVGGAVRNLLLGKTPKDWDVTTNARPELVQKLFKKVIPTGIKHGTVTVLWKGEAIEVTTFRTESKYEDHRRPTEVSFNGTLEEDLKRRDFTINAMALDLEDGSLIDFHHGQDDLTAKRIRAIGNAYDRFQEDALRMLRAPRFACQLGFTLDSQILSASRDLKNDLQFLSPERKRDELKKIFESKTPSLALEFFRHCDLWSNLFPWIHYEILGEQYHRLLTILDEISPEESLIRWMFFFLNFPLEEVNLWLKKMTFTNKEIQEILTLFTIASKTKSWQGHELGPFQCLKEFESRPEKKLIIIVENLYLLFQNNFFPKELSRWLKEIDEHKSLRLPLQIRELPINGYDLINLGLKDGKLIGETLQKLLIKIWETQKAPNKDEALSMVKTIIQSESSGTIDR